MTKKIKCIEMEVSGKTLKLSVKQAKELRDLLNENFPEKETKYITTYPVIHEVSTYRRPYWSCTTDINKLSLTSDTGQIS